MLKLLIISPDSALFRDNKCDLRLLEETADLVADLDSRGVATALWSRNQWLVDKTPVEEFFSAEAGVEVPFFRAGRGLLPSKGSKGSVQPILDHFAVHRFETALVGGNESDLQAATNNKLLLLRSSWYQPRTDYGLNMDTIMELKRFCMIFGLREHPLYWGIQDGSLNCFAMGPFSTYKIQAFARFGQDAKDAAKTGGGTPDFWLSAVLSSLYFGNLVQDVHYICAFPGHKPTSSSNIKPHIDETLVTLGQSLNVGYYRDLIVRHSQAPKSQDIRSASRLFAPQIDTLRLNRRPHRNGKATPNKSDLKLAGKRVLVVDDFITSGHSMDTARALIEAAGGEAILFAWLKTVNTPFVHMKPDPHLSPYEVNSVVAEPSSVSYPYESQVVDPKAPAELDGLLSAYANWAV